MPLNKSQADAVEAFVARVEHRKGVRITAAIIDKSDVCLELPWKAFALGTALAMRVR